MRHVGLGAALVVVILSQPFIIADVGVTVCRSNAIACGDVELSVNAVVAVSDNNNAESFGLVDKLFGRTNT